jgi:hypothetical protein
MTRSASRRGARSLVVLVLLATSPLLSTEAQAQSPTFARTDYPFLGNNIIAADFNNDGVLDLAGNAAQAAAVMLGNGNGSFRPAAQFPVASWTQDVAAGDFNRDGNQDLVVTINTPQIGLSLLVGNGDGTFDPPVDFPNTSGFDSPSVVAVDLNNDGKLDVVVAHQIACYTAPCVASFVISEMLGNGDGTFQPSREITVGRGMSRIAAGDFNRDGTADLAIAGDLARAYVLLGTGTGDFTQQTLELGRDNPNSDATDIDVADINGDTFQDLVVALGLNGSRTAVVLGTGSGTFQPPILITEPGLRIPQYQAVADYNGDGFQDLALSLGWGLQGLTEILNGNGDGTFQPLVLYNNPGASSSQGGAQIITADFNGDGRADIAHEWGGASTGLMIMINTTGSAPVPPAYGSVTVSPSTVVGGASATGTITLAPGAVAGSNGLRFNLASSNTSVATVPSSVTMAAGASRVTFAVGTRSVTSTRTVTISVSNSQLGNRSTSLTVTPAAPAPLALSSLTLTPTSVAGGSTSQGRVTLNRAATSATAVALSSGNPAATVPASVTVPSGASSATFTVTTSTVTATTSAAITASYAGSTRSASLTITSASSTPPAAPSLVSPAYDARFAPGATIGFDWSDVSGAASYTIQIDDSDSFSAPQIVSQTVTVSQYSTSTLPERTMWWRVRAVNSAGTAGPWSSVRRFRVDD